MSLLGERYLSEILPTAAPRATAVRVVVFPYAGGSAAVYSAWRAEWPRDWQLVGVTLPGRGHRLALPFDTDPARTIQAVAHELRQYPVAERTVFVGHSMGADVAFEVAHIVQPMALICLARAPEPLSPGSIDPHLLEAETRAELRARLTTLGIVDPVLADELLEMNVPILHADLALLSRFRPDPPPLPVPIVALYGADDDVEPMSWGSRSTRDATVATVDGDHFFATSDPTAVLHALHALVGDREGTRE